MEDHIDEQVIHDPWTMNVKLDYYSGKKQQDEPREQTLTLNYIHFAVDQKFKDGMRAQERRIYGRIQDKLENAAEEDIELVKFERAEVDFLKDVFREARFPAALSRPTVKLETAIFQLGK